jgi:hypothetical protein
MKYNVFFSFIYGNITVTKKRGSEFKQHTNRLHDPKRSCVSNLLHMDEISNLLLDTSLLILLDVHSMIRNIQVFYSHKPTEQIAQHPSSDSHIRINANKYKLPCCKLQTLPESTSSLYYKNVHQRLGSHWDLAFLMFLCSCLAKLLVQRNVLATSQTLR